MLRYWEKKDISLPMCYSNEPVAQQSFLQDPVIYNKKKLKFQSKKSLFLRKYFQTGS